MAAFAVDSHSYYAFPQMSPDGRYLYYAQAVVSGVAARLMRLDLMQKQVRQLAIIHQYFSMSPDGSAVAVPVVEKDKIVLRILGPEGEAGRDLTTFSAPDTLTAIAWSADSREVFFARTVGGKQTVLFRIPVSGGSPIPLTGAQMLLFRDLSVHANGRDLAFVSRTSDLEIWRLEGLAQSVAKAVQNPGMRTAQQQAKQ
jgi:Tol biopolymer transport system component